MDWLAMPPLAALRAFSAFAETGNVVGAGVALNVSHAAISQQIRALESHLGVALVDRSGRSLRLTEDGQRLAGALERGFGAIAAVLEDISQDKAGRPVHISVTPTFASAWLVPRLSAFRSKNPDIDLVLDPTPAVVDLAPGGIDVAVRYCNGRVTGHETEPLLISPVVVVAAPDLVAGRDIREPADLADMPWLEELGTNEATAWLRSQGVERGATRGSVQLPGGMLLSALRDGQGVSPVVRHFVQADLEAGRLVELFPVQDTAKGYYLVTRSGPLRPAAKAFVQWIKRQARAETVDGGIAGGLTGGLDATVTAPQNEAKSV